MYLSNVSLSMCRMKAQLRLQFENGRMSVHAKWKREREIELGFFFGCVRMQCAVCMGMN